MEQKLHSVKYGHSGPSSTICKKKINHRKLRFNSYDKPIQHTKKAGTSFCEKCPSSQRYSFSSGCVRMWELDHKEGWVLKNGCFQTVLLEKTLESPLDSKEIKPANPKENQPWIFMWRIDAEAEAPTLRSADVKSQLTEKDPDAGKNWRQEENEVMEDELVGWHHRLNWHEFEQTPRDSEGQGSLACCSPWGHWIRHDWAIEQQQPDF